MSMWQPFHEDARHAIVLAQEAAVQFGNNYIGTEHLLAGIIGLPGSGGARVLTEMGIDSLDLVVLMMAVEEEFRTEFTREQQSAFRTLADVAIALKASQI